MNQSGVSQLSPVTQRRNIKIPYIALCILTIILGVMFPLWAIRYQDGFGWGSYLVIQQWNWHALLTWSGFSIFFAESMLIFRLQKKWSIKITKIVHIAMNLIAFILTTVGLAAIFSTGVTDHFISYHSWIGLGTYLLFIAQFVCGILTHLVPTLPQFVSRYHRECGIMIYGLATITIATGLILRISVTLWATTWTDYGELLANFMGLFFIMFSGLVLYMMIHPQYKQDKI